MPVERWTSRLLSPLPTTTSRSERSRIVPAAAVLVAAFLIIYLPDAGRGFIKDDFAWIRNSTVEERADLVRLFQQNVGFYRPLVSASFAADAALWGLNPFGYAVTNTLLLAADALLLFALARRFALPAAAALAGVAVWAFNFHGINMAVLWLSGRTALLALLFCLATTHAFLRGHRLLAGLLCLGALLCKEEAVMLPVILAAFVAIEERRAPSGTWPLWLSLGVYAVLRLQSGAFGPGDAPSYYQFSLSPLLLLRNVAEYADRAATGAVAVAIVLLAALARRPSPLTGAELRALRFGALWVVGMYALTALLPVRSSLYAVLPSCGVALAVAVCASVVARDRPDRFRLAATGLVVLVVLLIPVYRSRNVRWVATADTSARVMRTLQIAAGSRPQGGRILLVDDPRERFNLDGAFGTLFPDALAIFVGSQWTGEISRTADAAARADLVFRYQDGGIVPWGGSTSRNDEPGAAVTDASSSAAGTRQN
jgi:hypothetical protein